MLRSPFQRSRRFAFMKSSMKKFKSQFKLMEGTHGLEDQYTFANEEGYHNNEGAGPRNSIYIPTRERLNYCMRLLYDDHHGWIEEKLEEKVEIFYDCEETTSGQAHAIYSRKNEVIMESFMHEKAEIMNEKPVFEDLIPKGADNYEKTVKQFAEKKLDLHVDAITNGAETPDMISKKGSKYCLIRAFMLGVIIAAIGSYFCQRLYMELEGGKGFGAFFSNK